MLWYFYTIGNFHLEILEVLPRRKQISKFKGPIQSSCWTVKYKATRMDVICDFKKPLQVYLPHILLNNCTFKPFEHPRNSELEIVKYIITIGKLSPEHFSLLCLKNIFSVQFLAPSISVSWLVYHCGPDKYISGMDCHETSKEDHDPQMMNPTDFSKDLTIICFDWNI